MRRVLQQESTSVEDCTIYVYDAPIDELLARLGENNGGQKAEAQPTWKILSSEEGHDAQVGALLDAHAQAQGMEFRTYRFHIEDDGHLIAGVTAWSLGPELHVDTLAVDEAYRRKGLGRRLLEHVEQVARENGCATASVDTFSFQAPDYYPTLGYEEQFRYTLDDGTERIFFRKRL
jgi:GNAT superfamily N-acetyltransferase